MSDWSHDVAIVDYGTGNLFSVLRACEKVGLSAEITSSPQNVEKSRAVVLPGVGAFGDAMDNLRSLGLVEALKASVERGKPFLGICLGMQLLMSESDEFGVHKGLEIVSGRVVKIPNCDGVGEVKKVPHVGWSQIYRPEHASGMWDDGLLQDLSEHEYMYFVHSFVVLPDDSDVVVCCSSYGGFEYCSGLTSRRVHAFQFHPERSGERGLLIYRNFARLVRGSKEKGV